jgi:hypothetical protein
MAWHGMDGQLCVISLIIMDGSKIESAKGMTFPLALRRFGFNRI